MAIAQQMDTARAEVEKQAAAFASARAALLTHDGQRIFPADEHDRRLAAALGPLEKAVYAAEREAENALKRSEVIRLEAFACPSATFSRADLEEAGAVRWLVQEECEALPCETLAERVRWASGENHLIAFLYGRYAGVRFQKETARREPVRGLAELGQALRGVPDVTNRGGRDHAREAEELRDAGQRLRILAVSTLQKAKGGGRPAATL